MTTSCNSGLPIAFQSCTCHRRQSYGIPPGLPDLSGISKFPIHLLRGPRSIPFKAFPFGKRTEPTPAANQAHALEAEAEKETAISLYLRVLWDVEWIDQ